MDAAVQTGPKVFQVNSNQTIALRSADGIDIIAFGRVVWRYRYFVVLVSLCFVLASVYLALTAKKMYRATVTVTEVHDEALSGAGSLIGRLGGLASMAGLNIGGAGPSAYAQGVLTSRNLIEKFVDAERLVPTLTKGMGNRETPWFATQRFQETVLAIHHDTQKGVTTISVDWTNPVIAADWANGFVALANRLIRAHIKGEASRNVIYLEGQTDKTQSVEIQKSLYGLIESQTKALMLANARSDYPFQVIDPAVPPGVRYSPKRALMVLSGAVIGLFAGVLIAITHNAIRRVKTMQ
ncbi:MAG TPA: hypothetical protein VND80_08785 [Steroidobacteraceae bacterium]|nr:hypothetical protein [Steroidobacteraceae bacterium]